MVDFYERIPDYDETMQILLDGRQVQIWTAQPGIITKISDLAGKITVDVQPAIQGKMRTPDGKTQIVNIGSIPDVPVVFPHGGGYVLTFPLAVGDEVLVVHGARNIDGWWQNGGVQPPLDSRLHDITDAFAIPGPYSQPKKFSALSTTKAQLRTEDGTLYAEIDSASKKVKLVSNAIYMELDSNSNAVNISGASTGTITTSTSVTVVSPTVNINASSNVTITSPLVTITGNLAVNGTVVGGSGGSDAVGLQSHRHTQANDSRGDTQQPTNAPTPGT